MAAITQTLPVSTKRFRWLWELLKQELTPYPGRAFLVARLVTATTLVMIISMTFRIPFGAYAGIWALVLSRESLEGTAVAVRMIAIGFVLAGAYVVVGAMLFLGDPTLRLLWVVGTLFLIFYLLSAMRNYIASARFGYLIIITLSLWDRHISENAKVEETLWAVGAITIATVITLLLEIVFSAIRQGNALMDPITERLSSVEDVLRAYANNSHVNAATQSGVTRLAIMGTSRLRHILRHSNYGPQYAQQMGAVVALVGRLVDIAANLTYLSSRANDDDRQQILNIAQSMAAIRAGLVSGIISQMAALPREVEARPGLPLLRELETTVSLIPQVFRGSESLHMYELPASHGPAILLPGALSDIEHVKFALRGCLAASFCYIIYNALFWPEISTSVTTCFLTALTTIGASRQKQFLRFTGALIGALGIGMGAQVFILPYIDSIGAFTMLFAAVAIVGAWIATSSPRLSYLGAQLVVAFCLINLPEFRLQTSLSVARDRVIGILLGLFMMWLFFDHLWSAPAVVEMKKVFISNLRLLAQLAREPLSNDIRVAIERSYALREAINAQFDEVRSLADAVLFEFGPSRQWDLALRHRIRQWQPQLRTLFVMQTTSRKYRLQLPGFELPEAVRHSQQKFDHHLADLLDGWANHMDDGRPIEPDSLEESFGQLQETARTCCADDPQKAQLQTLLALYRNIATVSTLQNKNMAIT
jgi:multidrug resistance protein MdtO